MEATFRPLYPCTYWVGGLDDPRAGLDTVANRKLPDLDGNRKPGADPSHITDSYPRSSKKQRISVFQFLWYQQCSQSSKLHNSVSVLVQGQYVTTNTGQNILLSLSALIIWQGKCKCRLRHFIFFKAVISCYISNRGFSVLYWNLVTTVT
jgi:hypothetical protein